jgi:hypothetical protein
MMPDPGTMRECLDEAVAGVAKLKTGRVPGAGTAAKKRGTAKPKKAVKKVARSGGKRSAA